jgi:hypothetical protein
MSEPEKVCSLSGAPMAKAGNMSKRNETTILVSVILVTAVILSFSGQEPAWKGSINTERGIMVIRNPKTPLYDGKILTLVKDLTVGGPAVSGESVIASARTMAVDDAENIYVLDEKTSPSRCSTRAERS